MANRTRTSSRGGSRAAPRRGSGGNPMLVVVPILLVVGVIALIIVFGSGRSGPPKAPPAPPATTPTVVKPPPKAEPPPPPPYPPLDPKRVEEIRAEVKTFEPLVEKGKALYDEAMAAKNAGDDATWQAKLREASQPFDEIQDRWNEIIASMPSTKDYSEEDVANHYLGKEGNQVRKYMDTLAAIKKSRRIQ